MNKIIQGDSLEVYATLPDGCVDLIVTDPPYQLDNSACGEAHLKMSLQKLAKPSKWAGAGARLPDGKKDIINLQHIVSGWEYERHMEEWLRLCPKFHAFVFCSTLQVPILMNWSIDHGFITNLLVWNKTNTAPLCHGVWRQDAEFIVHMRAKGTVFQGKAKEKIKVWQSPTVRGQWGHPTEKPVELIARYIRIGSNEGMTIFDPFSGSGTTAEAAIRTDRKYICIEKDPTYHAASVRRIENYFDGKLPI